MTCMKAYIICCSSYHLILYEFDDWGTGSSESHDCALNSYPATRQTHLAFYPVDSRIISPGVKQPSRDFGHLIPSVTKIKNKWRYA